MFQCYDYRAVSISIHALRREGDRGAVIYAAARIISIHALRREGDRYADSSFLDAISISIHALRREGDWP